MNIPDSSNAKSLSKDLPKAVAEKTKEAAQTISKSTTPTPSPSSSGTSTPLSIASSQSDPGSISSSSSSSDDSHNQSGHLQDEDEDPTQGAFNPETGEINWDCPCLGGMAHGPCGEEFKAAFSCFVYSQEEPKGQDCIEKFRGMQECFRAHPEAYGEGEPAFHALLVLEKRLTRSYSRCDGRR